MAGIVRALAAASFASCLATAAHGGDYWRVGEAGAHDHYFVDWSSVATWPNGDRNIWVTSAAINTDGQTLSSTKELVRYSCQSTQSETLAYVKYDAHGEVLDSADAPYPEWHLTIPESIGEHLRRFVCGYGDKADYEQANHLGEVDPITVTAEKIKQTKAEFDAILSTPLVPDAPPTSHRKKHASKRSQQSAKQSQTSSQ